ncbi:hypothetical protein Tco_0674091 [Tanacetum coccineum]
MTTLAKFMIIVGADNRPPMLEKSLYDSWKSRMELYMENRENGRMILDSVLNGPLVWPTIVQEDGTTRKKTYAELFATEKIQADCDLKATNIATIQDGRITVQQVQGRQGQSYVGTGYKGHMARQYTQPKRPRNAAWFKKKAMLAEAHESGQVLDKEQLTFLADLGIPNGQAAQTTILNKCAFQIGDLDSYDSDCDDVSNAKVVLMANLSNYGSDVISEGSHSKPYHNDMDNQKLSTEQAFWLQTSNPNTEQSNISPGRIEAPSELPKASLVNTSLKKLKFHLSNFDTVVKKQITPDTITEREWGLEHTKVVFLKEIIPFLKTLKDTFNVFDRDLLNEDVLLSVLNSTTLIGESVNLEMQRSESCDKCFDLDDELSKTKNDSLILHLNSKSVENANLKAQIQDKVFVITSLKNDLRKLKGKEIVENDAQIPIATTIAPGMFKLDLDPLASRLLRNREYHIEYLKHTQEQGDILRGIVKQAKAKQPLDNALDFACKHAQRIQELLVYVRDTCPNAIKLSAKKVTVTPKNNVKKATLNRCGSKHTGNKKNDRISRTPSRNMKNKVEAQPRKVNKKNHVVEPIRDVDVKHSLLKANSELICATCKKSMFDGVHDMCLLDFVKNVNSRSKSAKKHKK